VIIRAIIADDELLMRRSIRRLFETHSSVEVQAECCDGPSTVKAIAKHDGDVIFLEVQMSGFEGIQVVSEIGLDKMPLTVFVTAPPSRKSLLQQPKKSNTSNGFP
jgi:two-component system, LytTR family, response regulator